MNEYTKLGQAIVDEASFAESLDDHISLIMEHGFKFKEIVETMMGMYPLDVNELLDTDELNMYVSDKLGNDLFINDPERAERIHDAAKDGATGSTHGEIIEDWYDFISISDYPDWIKDMLRSELDALSNWHEGHGTLNDIVG